MKRVICMILLMGSTYHAGCEQRKYNFTENKNSKTVQLRNELIGLASGKTKEITGSIQPMEGFVLMYGYMLTDSMNQLPISPTLHAKLEEISPTPDYEIYVLAQFHGDDILQYTSWQNDGKLLPGHPNLKAPFVISGSPYRVRLRNTSGDVEISN